MTQIDTTETHETLFKKIVFLFTMIKLLFSPLGECYKDDAKMCVDGLMLVFARYTENKMLSIS